MTYEQEMDRFFYAYKPDERKRIEALPDFQKAAMRGNIPRSQEIAVAELKGIANSKTEAREIRSPREFVRTLDL